MDPAPTIAIVGRPNVGKSTLFNRLIGKRHAVIAHEAGTTRDRIYQKLEIQGQEIQLVDTGGIEDDKKEDIEENIQAQANIAIQEADLIVFVIDLIEDLTADDFTAADILRKSKKPIILVANKCDNPEIEKNIFNIFELGFGEPIAISAIHKHGIDALRDEVIKNLKTLGFKKGREKKEEDEMTDICILGKPNAGKSSLVNALLGDDKVIVSDIPGTTRDATDTEITYKDKRYNLIDTAGLRRPGKIERGIEKFSTLRCFSSLERSDVAVLVIDGDLGVTTQDPHITEHVLKAKKGLIIAINKADLLHEEDQERIIRYMRKKFEFTPWAPVIFISAKQKKNTYQILKLADEIMKQRRKRIQTAEFNSFMQKIVQKHLPASRKVRKPKFMYGSQVEVEPPRFTLFFSNVSNMHFSYPRYIENQIRDEYGFRGTPIELFLKPRSQKAKPI